MIKIIKESWVEECKEYSRVFTCLKDTSFGYSFPCNEDGTQVFLSNPAAVENYEEAMRDSDYRDDGVVCRTYTVRHPATARCHCGAEIELVNQYLGACECPECGRWYNLSGQELKNPERWNDYGEMDYNY